MDYTPGSGARRFVGRETRRTVSCHPRVTSHCDGLVRLEEAPRVRHDLVDVLLRILPGIDGTSAFGRPIARSAIRGVTGAEHIRACEDGLPAACRISASATSRAQPRLGGDRLSRRRRGWDHRHPASRTLPDVREVCSGVLTVVPVLLGDGLGRRGTLLDIRLGSLLNDHGGRVPIRVGVSVWVPVGVTVGVGVAVCKGVPVPAPPAGSPPGSTTPPPPAAPRCATPPAATPVPPMPTTTPTRPVKRLAGKRRLGEGAEDNGSEKQGARQLSHDATNSTPLARRRKTERRAVLRRRCAMRKISPGRNLDTMQHGPSCPSAHRETRCDDAPTAG